MINLNDRVILKLNTHGAKIYNEYYSTIDDSHAVNDGDVIKLELWHMAHIFGPFLFNGLDLPFESTNMDFNQIMKSILCFAFGLYTGGFLQSVIDYPDHRDLFEAGYKFMMMFVFGLLFFMSKEK